MKGKILEAKVFIKKKLGLCNSKGCYKRAVSDIYINCINVRRCLCIKHLEEFKEVTGFYNVGIDLAPGEDKVGIIKNTFRRESSKKNISRKSEEEKQLDKLYCLYKRVKKNRVKKKIKKRICKLKRKVKL